MNSLHENTCFSMVSVFRGGLPIWGLFLTCCWFLAGLPARAPRQSILPEHPARAQLDPGLSWPLAGLSFWFPRQSIPLENRIFKGLPKLLNSLHENTCFSMASAVRGVPPIWGLLLVSCCPLPGLLVLASFKLPHEDFSRKSVFQRVPKIGEFSSLKGLFFNEFCFSWGPPIWSLFLASCWPLAGLLLASCWLLAGFLLASCWLLPGLLLAPWLLAK